MNKVNPAIGAAILFLLDREGVRPDWDGWPSSEAEVLAMTGANRDEARALYARLCELLPATVEAREHDPAECMTLAVAGFLACHPDAVGYIDGKRVYSDDFREFIAAMHPKHSPAEHELLAHYSLGMYEAWLQCSLSNVQGFVPTAG